LPEPVDYRRTGKRQGASVQQALWSCAVAAAFIFILGVTFYGISAQRESSTAALPPAATTSPTLASEPAEASTTGRGSNTEAEEKAAR
jgi:hypothetical protein